MSNLLQKASIVTTPTAYGVGVLNSIKPAIPFRELIVNGNFYNGTTNWTATNAVISASNSVLTVDDSANQGTDSRASQSFTTKVGLTYKVKFNRVSTTSTFYLGLGSGADYKNIFYLNLGTNLGFYERTFIATNTTSTIALITGGTGISKFSEVSVKEITDADFDFTRTSSATRVNPDYLIETVSINSANLVQNGNFSELSSELVTNGDFATDSDWVKSPEGMTISGGFANFTSGQDTYVFQDIMTIGKQYYIVLEYNISSLTGSAYFGSNGGSGNAIISMTGLSGSGTLSGYITASASKLIIRSSSLTGTITNVSVKQVDPNDNWRLFNGATITDNKANIIGDGSAFGYIEQLNTFTSGKKYKITLDAVINSGGGLVVKYALGFSANIGSITTSGSYTFSYTAGVTGSIIIGRKTGGTAYDSSITNISVIEIQENGVPRLDYTNGTASILLENQSTNLFEYDIDFSQVHWNKGNVTLQSNIAISPEGLSNASNIYPTNNVAYIYNSTTASSSIYTISAYVKANGKNVAWLYINSSNTNGVIYFDLSDESMQVVSGSVGTPIGTINKMPNSWYRITYTTGTSTALATGSGVGVSDAKGSFNATQNGTDGILIYGLQIEAQSFSTSLIHTSGSATTRAAETLNNAGNSDLINSTEGVLYAEIAALANDGTGRKITLNNGSNSNVLVLEYTSTANQIRVFLSNGTLQFNEYVTLSNLLVFNKIAIKYKANDFAIWINGVEIATDLSGTTFTSGTLTSLNFDDGSGNADFFGKCKTVAVFKESLSDSELACLTSTNNREIFLNYYYRMQYVGANTEALSCAEQTFNV